MQIPRANIYHDSVSQKKEIWIQDGKKGDIQKWLRCIPKTGQERRGCINLVQVDVQECVEKIQSVFLKLFHQLLNQSIPETAYYIPDREGKMGSNFATPTGPVIQNQFLAWSEEETIVQNQELKIIKSCNGIHLVEIADRPNSEQTAFYQCESEPQIDLNGEIQKINVLEDTALKFISFLLEKQVNLGLEKPELVEKLQQIIIFFRYNSRNPLKSFAIAKQESMFDDSNLIESLQSMEEPYFFTYAQKKELGNSSQEELRDAAMAFSPIHRAVVMKDLEKAKDSVEMALLLHEMVHCIAASRERKRDYKKHFCFNMGLLFPGRKSIVAEEEFEAYAIQCEAINLCVDNELFIAAQRNQALNPIYLASRFESKPDPFQAIGITSAVASIYFRESSIGNYSEEYKRLISRMLLKYGQDIYSPEYELIESSPDNRESIRLDVPDFYYPTQIN